MIKVKNLRQVSQVTESFALRWQYFVYIEDPEGPDVSGLSIDEDTAEIDLNDDRKIKQKFKFEELKKKGELRFFCDDLKKSMNIDVETFMPIPTLTNCISKLRVTQPPELIYKQLTKDDGGVYYAWCYTETVDGTMSHSFDLVKFPFDNHTLELDYRLTRLPFRGVFYLKTTGGLLPGTGIDDHKECIPYWKYNDETPDCMYVSSKTPDDDEKAPIRGIQQALEFEPYLVSGPEYDLCLPTLINDKGGKHRIPRIVFPIKVVRKADYYMGNVLLIASLIASIIFALILVHPDFFATRLGTNVSVLFTTVSFGGSVSSNLPRLAYDNYITTHTNVCYATIVTMIIANVVIFLASPPRWVDILVYACIFALWVYYNQTVWSAKTKLADNSPKWTPRPRGDADPDLRAVETK